MDGGAGLRRRDGAGHPGQSNHGERARVCHTLVCVVSVFYNAGHALVRKFSTAQCVAVCCAMRQCIPHVSSTCLVSACRTNFDICAAAAALLACAVPPQATRRGRLAWAWSAWPWCCSTSLTSGACAVLCRVCGSVVFTRRGCAQSTSHAALFVKR